MARLVGWVALSLCVALGCSKPEASPASETEVPEPAPAHSEAPASESDAAPSAAAPEAVRTEVVSLVPSELAKTDTEGVGKHCLDCSVKQAKYTYCFFRIDELNALVGADRLDTEASLRVEMRPRGSENFVPKDPHAPQPAGGFTHLHFDCKATGLAE